VGLHRRLLRDLHDAGTLDRMLHPRFVEQEVSRIASGGTT
jgi:hypothetical protein